MATDAMATKKIVVSHAPIQVLAPLISADEDFRAQSLPDDFGTRLSNHASEQVYIFDL